MCYSENTMSSAQIGFFLGLSVKLAVDFLR